MPILLKGEAYRRAASVGLSLVRLLGDGRRPLHGADIQKVANNLLLISHIYTNTMFAICSSNVMKT